MLFFAMALACGGQPLIKQSLFFDTTVRVDPAVAPALDGSQIVELVVPTDGSTTGLGVLDPEALEAAAVLFTGGMGWSCPQNADGSYIDSVELEFVAVLRPGDDLGEFAEPDEGQSYADAVLGLATVSKEKTLTVDCVASWHQQAKATSIEIEIDGT